MANETVAIPGLENLDNAQITAIAGIMQIDANVLIAQRDAIKAKDGIKLDKETALEKLPVSLRAVCSTLDSLELKYSNFQDFVVTIYKDWKKSPVADESYNWTFALKPRDNTKRGGNNYQLGNATASQNGSKRKLGAKLSTATTTYPRIGIMLIKDAEYTGELPLPTEDNKQVIHDLVAKLYPAEVPVLVAKGMDSFSQDFLREVHKMHFPESYEDESDDSQSNA